LTNPCFLFILYHGRNIKNNQPDAEKEQVIIEGVPIQFIPVYNDLVKDAVINAQTHNYASTRCRVFRPEYLIALMLQTLRPKDKDRLAKFLDQSDFSDEDLDLILAKYKLKDIFNTLRSK